MKFIIDRSKWLRGEGMSESRLLRISDGKMCCVGQMCRRLGATQYDLSGRRGVSDVVGLPAIDDTLKDGHKRTKVWVTSAYRVNDDTSINDVDREASLRRLAESDGHEIEFIN